MRLKLVSLICLGIFLAIPNAPAQERTTAKLNRHFIEIQKDDTKNHQYNKVETVFESGETVTWIFDLQNRMVKQSKKSKSAEGNFNQEITETFDSANHLVSQRITNLDNTKYVEFHYRDGVKMAQVTHHGQDKFEIWRNNPDSVYSLDHNDFLPGGLKKEWQSHFAKELTYPTAARRIGAEGSVVLAILVDKNGNVNETEVANASLVHPELAKEALRVALLFDGKFSPAINLDGQPEEIWVNIPVRFKLGY